MARKNFSPGALTAPVPATLVSCGTVENPNVITIAWTGILNTKPPKTYISVRPSRHSYNIIKESGEFVINLPPASLVKEVDWCGIRTGRCVDKFKECGLTAISSNSVAAPTIANCPISLECRVCDIIEMGSHHVFIADIVNVSTDDSIIDKNGKMCFEKADLLAYIHGEYFEIGKKIGTFGFSQKQKRKTIEKNKTTKKSVAERKNNKNSK